MAQLSATPAARAPLAALRRALRPRVAALRDVMGHNLAALGRLQRYFKNKAAGAL